MTVWVLWNVWEEMEALPAMVAAADRVLGSRSRHVFVDGRYPTFPGDLAYSTDGTLAFAADTGTLVPLAADECAKRTAGLRAIDEMAKPGDYVLVLDADEELSALAVPAAPVGIVEWRRDSDGVVYDRARLVRWEPGLWFARHHYEVWDSHGRLVASLTTGDGAVTCGTGIHHDTDRTRARAVAKSRYYRWLADHEAVSA